MHPKSLVTPRPVVQLPAAAVERMVRTERLGEAIAELAARLHAATYELLVLLREFDAANGWNNGFLSCAHWLHWRTGIDLGAAREKVRVARALAALPRLSAALQRGQLSYAKARAVTRIATPENEAQLIDVALAGTTAHVERLVRAWRRVDRIAAARETEQRHLQRSLSTYVDGDGMVVIRGRLTPEIGAVLQRALEAAADRLFRESVGTPAATTLAEEVTPSQRRSDALGLLAESALAADLDRGTAGDRYQVVLHVEGGALRSDEGSPVQDAGATGGEAAGIGRVTLDSHDDIPPGPRDSTPAPTATGDQAVIEVDGGPVDVSYETSQRLACDAGVVVMRHDPDGSVLDVGRKTRTIPPAIRRALVARDRQCRFPGCTARRCDAHHVVHWADGGTTCLENLLCLCRTHHRAVHEGGFGIRRDVGGVLIFIRPDGTQLRTSPPPNSWMGQWHAGLDDATTLLVRERSDPVGPTVARLAAAGVVVDGKSTACWDGTRFDVAWTIDVMRGHEPIARQTPSV